MYLFCEQFLALNVMFAVVLVHDEWSYIIKTIIIRYLSKLIRWAVSVNTEQWSVVRVVPHCSWQLRAVLIAVWTFNFEFRSPVRSFFSFFPDCWLHINYSQVYKIYGQTIVALSLIPIRLLTTVIFNTITEDIFPRFSLKIGTFYIFINVSCKWLEIFFGTESPKWIGVMDEWANNLCFYCIFIYLDNGWAAQCKFYFKITLQR